MPRDRFLVLFSFAVLAVITAGYLAQGPRPIPTPKAGAGISPFPQAPSAFTEPKWFPITDCAAGVEMKKQTPEAFALLTSQSCVKRAHAPFEMQNPCIAGALPDGSFVYGTDLFDASDGICRWRCPIADDAQYSMYLDAGRKVGYYYVSKSLYRADFAIRKWALVAGLEDLVIPSQISALGKVELDRWHLLLVRSGCAYFTGHCDKGNMVLKLEMATNSLSLLDLVNSREGVCLEDGVMLAQDSDLYQMVTPTASGPEFPVIVVRDLSRPGVSILDARASFCTLRSSDKHLFVSYDIEEKELVELAPDSTGYSEVRRLKVQSIPDWMQFDGRHAYFWPKSAQGCFCDVMRLPGLEIEDSHDARDLFPAGAAFGSWQVVWNRDWVNAYDCKTGQLKFPACSGYFSDPRFALAEGADTCCWLDRNKAQIWDYTADRAFAIPLPPELQADSLWYNSALPGFVIGFEDKAPDLNIRLIEGRQPLVFRGSVSSERCPEGMAEPYTCSLGFTQPPTSWPGTADETPFRGVYFAEKVFRLEDGVVVRYAANGGKHAFTTPAPVEHYAPVTETVILADKNLVNLAGKVLPVGECFAMPEALIYEDPVHNKWVRLGKDGSFAQVTMSSYRDFTADLAGTGNCVICCDEDFLLCKWQPREPDETDRQIAAFLGWGK
ncbi:MAG: hypothetical protein WC712_10965 [Candidatus Brocadiia bacterium]